MAQKDIKFQIGSDIPGNTKPGYGVGEICYGTKFDELAKIENWRHLLSNEDTSKEFVFDMFTFRSISQALTYCQLKHHDMNLAIEFGEKPDERDNWELEWGSEEGKQQWDKTKASVLKSITRAKFDKCDNIREALCYTHPAELWRDGVRLDYLEQIRETYLEQKQGMARVDWGLEYAKIPEQEKQNMLVQYKQQKTIDDFPPIPLTGREQGDLLLNINSGFGLYAQICNTFFNVTAIDPNRAQLAVGVMQGEYKDIAVRPVKLQELNSDHDGKYDVVMCLYMNTIPKQEEDSFFSHLWRVLKPRKPHESYYGMLMYGPGTFNDDDKHHPGRKYFDDFRVRKRIFDGEECTFLVVYK
jgi:2-polyprenyl-3-methyl-5-hydroxy-6-metoxy-1,4-benzoquinol methylase